MFKTEQHSNNILPLETKQYNAKSYASLQRCDLRLKKMAVIDIIFGDTAVLSDMISKEPEIQFVGEKVTDKKIFR